MHPIQKLKARFAAQDFREHHVLPYVLSLWNVNEAFLRRHIKDRGHAYVNIRRAAIYALYIFTRRSLPEVARFLRGPKAYHTGIYAAVDQVRRCGVLLPNGVNLTEDEFRDLAYHRILNMIKTPVEAPINPDGPEGTLAAVNAFRPECGGVLVSGCTNGHLGDESMYPTLRNLQQKDRRA